MDAAARMPTVIVVGLALSEYFNDRTCRKQLVRARPTSNGQRLRAVVEKSGLGHIDYGESFGTASPAPCQAYGRSDLAGV